MISIAQQPITSRKIVKSASTKKASSKKLIVKGEGQQVNYLTLDGNNDFQEIGFERGISTLTPTVICDPRALIVDITAAIIADENYVETSSKTLKAKSYKIESDKLIPFVVYDKPADVKRITGETITAMKKNPQLLLANATNFVQIMKVFSLSTCPKSEFHFGFKRKQSSDASTKSDENDNKKKSVSCTHVQLFFTYCLNTGTFDANGNALFVPKFCRLTFKLHSAADKKYAALPEGTTIDMQFPTIMTATNNSWAQYKRENGFVPKSTVAEPEMTIQGCQLPYEQALALCCLKASEIEGFLQTVQSTQISALKGNKKEKNSRKRKASEEICEEEEGILAPKAKVNKTETTTSASSSLIPQTTTTMQEDAPVFNLDFVSTNMQQVNATTLEQQVNLSESQQVPTNLDLSFMMYLFPLFGTGQQFDASLQPQSLLPEGQQVFDFSAYLGQQLQQPQEQQEAEQSFTQSMSFSEMMMCDEKKLLN